MVQIAFPGLSWPILLLALINGSDRSLSSLLKAGWASDSARFALLLTAVFCACFSDVVFGGATFYFRDFSHFGYPLAHYHRESFWRGEIPLWNPLNDCGLPFLAQWNTLVLYPGSLFYCIFPLHWSLAVYCLAHLVLAGLGMFQLARRWTGNSLAASVAGVAFSVNGLALNFLMWPNNVAALAWMPFVILFVDAATAGRKGGVIKAAFFGGIQMLCGAPEVIMTTWVVAGVLSFVASPWTITALTRAGLRLALVVGLVSAVAAAQLLPFLDLLAHSHRDSGFGQAQWAMPSTGWANFLVPLFRSVKSPTGVFMQYDQYWTSSYYLGVGVILFASMGLLRVRNARVYALGFLALLGLMLALGNDGYLLPFLHKLFPASGYMRFPIKLIMLTTVTVPLLAAYGVRECLGDRTELSSRLMVWVGAVLALLIVTIVIYAKHYPEAGEVWGDTWRSGLSRMGFLACVLGWVYWCGKRAIPASAAALVLLLLLAVDVMTHTPSQNPRIPWDRYEMDLLEIKDRPTQGNGRVLVTPRAHHEINRTFTTNPETGFVVGRLWLFANFNLMENVPKLDGFYSLYLRQYHDIWVRIQSGTNKTDWTDLFNFLGVKHFTAQAADRLFKWKGLLSDMPMVTLGQRPEFLDDETVLKRVSDETNDFRSVVFLPSEASSSISAWSSTNSHVLSSQFKNHQINFQTESDRPAMAVIAQSYYHLWRATIDGSPVRVWRANHAFQALEVPAGRHSVILIYDDGRFRLGAWVSVLTLLGLAGGWVIGRRKVSSATPA